MVHMFKWLSCAVWNSNTYCLIEIVCGTLQSRYCYEVEGKQFEITIYM